MVLLAVAAVCAVAVLDAALGTRAVLVELLVIGPILASLRGTPRETAAVAVLAFAVAVPLGVASDAFGSAEHVIGTGAVAVVGALAVAIAMLRTSRERDAARLAVQYRVARTLSESKSLEAVPRLLAAIGEPLGWELGHLWAAGDGGKLHSVGAWTAAGVEVDEFEAATRRLVLEPGRGLAGAVWNTGRAAFLAEMVASGHFLREEEARRSGIRDGIVFPARGGDECVGVVELFSRTERAPEPEMLELTDALGILVGDWIESLRAAEAVRESEALKGSVLTSALDAVIVIDHEGSVAEFNPAAEAMFGRPADLAIGSELAELVVPPRLRERHRRALRRNVETGEATLLGERIELPAMRADGTEFPIELAINRIPDRDPPMYTGTVRDITARRRADEEREELLRLEQLARRDATEARDQLQAILEGIADAVTAQAPDGRLLFANQAAVELLGFESSEALLSAPVADIMGRFAVFDEFGETLSLDRLPGRQALAQGVAGEVVVRFRVRETGEERWSAVKAAPIRDGDGSVTMAINVIEDITVHKRAERAQSFLSNSTAVLGSSLDEEEVLRQVALLAVPSIADWLFIDLVDGAGVRRVAVEHADPERLERAKGIYASAPPARNAPGGVPQVLRTAAPELHSDLPTEFARAGSHAPYFRLARELGMRSAIVVPMVARDRTLGALTLASDSDGRRFDGSDLELAEELARRCATAIDNARLFSDRSYIARTLQESLLPAELPDIPGFEAAARFRPTGEGNEVGGDFYDLFETSERGWTVVMGDVCGKGPDAAAVTALARYTLRAVAMRERLPSRSLRALNEALLRQRDDRRFCTVAYAYLETVDDGARVSFASGGHPLPLLLRADGAVEFVGEPGSLVGVLPDPSFVDRSLSLHPGDALVFYTDGVIEGRGPNGSLDETGLASLLATCTGAGADAIASTVEEAAIAAAAGNPRDDIAVLVLRVAG